MSREHPSARGAPAGLRAGHRQRVSGKHGNDPWQGARLLLPQRSAKKKGFSYNGKEMT